jgi:hypothetical protein
MIAQVSVENKDICPVLAAHIFTVCPAAIPRLPQLAPNASEEELMQSLGMQKQADGTYETFERFLGRTEVSLDYNNYSFRMACTPGFLTIGSFSFSPSFQLLLISWHQSPRLTR